MSVSTRAPLAHTVEPRNALYGPLGLPVFVAFAGLLPGLVVLQPGSGSPDFTFYLQLGFTCYAGARLAVVIMDAQMRLIQGVFWLFCYTAMGIAPLAQEVLGRTPTPVVGTQSSLTLATVLTLFGCVAYDMGCLAARRYDGGDPSALARMTFSRGRVYGLTVLAFAASALLVVRLGPGSFFSSRQALTTQLADTGLADAGSQVGAALLRGFGTVPALLALLIMTRWLVTSTEARRRPALVLVWFALLGLNIMVNNPISNPRYWFLAVILSLLFVTFPTSAKVYRTALLVGALAALFLFPFADRFRYEEGGYRQLGSSSFLEPMTIKDYDQMAMFANAVHYAQAGPGHTGGEQLAGALLFWVPRSIWPDKPTDTGVLLGEWMGTNNVNLSAPLWAELWLDLGLIGMCGGFLILGYVSARADRLYRNQTVRDPHPTNGLAVLVPVIASYELIVLRGSLLQAMGRVGILVMCVVLLTAHRPGARPRD